MEATITRYVSRPLARTLHQCPRRVAILEGARAVGKTRLVQKELPDGYHYETLADKRTFDYASAHLTEWVESLPVPCIIDEAQRIPDLPLAIKEVSDRLSGRTPSFILTGSAAITRTGLDGQDPLTRRSARYTLYPLTRRELNGNAGVSVVDELWSGTPNTDYQSTMNREMLARFMAVGGFPSYVVSPVPMTEGDLRLSLRTDIDNMLGDTILPGERLDRTIADAVLRELLVVPGGILNVKKISDSVNSKPATINRYVSIFLRRFLISALPNLRLAPGKQTFTRAKIHPVDTSFSIEILHQTGRDFRNDRVLFGELFESFVVNQIVPEIQWSTVHPDPFYWRETGSSPKEVDLVLLHDNQLVAVEMKSNTEVKRDDFAGIAALAKADDRFHRGYVLYAGKTVQQFNERMWAIPISALWDSDGFLSSQSRVKELSHDLSLALPQVTLEEAMEVPIDANIFLSYSHADDEHLNGEIIALADEMVREYQYEFGSDLNLFVDKRSINWGADWRQVIDKGIGTANIILPIITPNYVRSKACRQELLDFNAKATEDGSNRILPLILQDIDGMAGISDRDPVWQIAHDRQWLKIGELRLMTQPERQRTVLEIVKKLRSVVQDIGEREILAKAVGISDSASRAMNDDSDLLTLWQNIKLLVPETSKSANKFGDSLKSITATVNAHPFPVNGSSTVYSVWASRLATSLQPDLDKLDSASQVLSDQWQKVYDILMRYVDVIQSLPQGSLRNGQIDGISATLDGLRVSFSLSPEVTGARPIIRMIGNFARPLQSFANTMLQAFALIENMGTMVSALQNNLDQIPR